MLWQPIRHRMQSELIKRGHCVACTRSLSEAEREDSTRSNQIAIVTCQCRRIYIYDKSINNYKRALIEEVEYHLASDE